MLSSRPTGSASSRIQDEKGPKLSNSIRQFLFSGAMNINLIESICEHTGTESNEDDLYYSMTCIKAFVALVLAKDASFGAGILLRTACDIPLTDIVSRELATSLDNLQAGLAKILYTGNSKSASDIYSRNELLREKLQQVVSSYGQDFIFCPPTHMDSVVVCRFLAAFNPTALATSQRVAHHSIKGDLYINLAYLVAQRLGILPETGSRPFAGTNSIIGLEMKQEFIMSVQGLQLIVEEFLLGDPLSKSLNAFRHVLQKMQPHIDSYQMLLQTASCTSMMVFHIKWTTAIYMLVEAMAEMKQNWMNPSRLFIAVEAGEKKCLAEIDSAYQLLSEASPFGDHDEQSEIIAICSLLELRFHTVISKLFGFGLGYISLFQARILTGQWQSDAEVCRREVTQMGNVIVNSLLSAPNHQRDSHFFKFLDHFGNRYPDKLQGLLAKFMECTTMKWQDKSFVAPIQPMILDIVSHCKNIIENNLLRLRVSGRLHCNFDKQLDLFTQCAHQISAMAALLDSSPERADEAYNRGCVYTASIDGWDEALGAANTVASPYLPTTISAFPEIPSAAAEAIHIQFKPLEAWDLWAYSAPSRHFPLVHNLFEPTMQSHTATRLDEETSAVTH
ncbi:hypothetical protein MKX08_002832 [Trichoderma sp. CBMAI-0020]|nr:hypothetical protein MKX08_002832 [Trichoderma sp. CBMAI-0020]